VARGALSTLVGIAWRTVGSILERVRAEGEAARDPLNGVRRIGIDEVSYRKGHRFLTVVVDHDTGHLLWAEAGRDEKTVRKFFRLLGKKRCKAIELVSADAAAWIGNVVRERCPNAKLCIDPFHVVAWATKALDEVRRGLWNKLRKKKEASDAKAVKGTRWALLKNPENLTRNQRRQLDAVEREHQPLFKAYLLKEQLREVFRTRDWQAPFMLNAWLERADESAIKPLKKVAAAIRTNLEGIYSALLHGLSNARLESANNKLRLLTRMAYGFHSHKPLIALAMLKLGGLCPPLPTARPPTG
jgi:transposase